MTAATIGCVLSEAEDGLVGISESPRLDAEVLLASVLGKPRSHLHAWPEKILSADHVCRFRKALAERGRGLPVAYITGEREFWSRAFRVGPDVLIPRPETELLVEITLDLLPPDRHARIIDLGTGSGAIAVTLAAERPRLCVTATDVCPMALKVARLNAARHAPDRIEWVESDWFESVPAASFDLVLSNPPYIAKGDPHVERGDVRFEPFKALVSGCDGLDAVRTIAGQAVERLCAGGYLLFEHGYDQAAGVAALLAAFGYTEIRHHRDLQGHPRVTSARRGFGTSAPITLPPHT